MSELLTEEELKDACQKILDILQGERNAEEGIPAPHVIDVLGFTFSAYLSLCPSEVQEHILRTFTESVRAFINLKKEE